jgi:hypothetical protein
MLSNILLSRLGSYLDEIIGDHQCGFDATDQLLIRFSAFVRYWRRGRREVLYNVLIEFGVPRKLVRLI